MTSIQIRIIIISILIAISIFSPYSSKALENRNLAWFSYSNTLKFNQHWSLNNDISERLFMSPFAQNQVIYRLKVSKKLWKKSLWDFSPGIAFSFQNTPQNPYRNQSLIIPEIRPQIEFNGKQKLSKISFQHRFRLESRIFHHTSSDKKELTKGFYYKNARFRYLLAINIPILTFKDNQKLQLKVGDEIHLNLLAKSTINTFDHNRFFSSLIIDVAPNTSIETGYQLWYKENTISHFFRLGISQTIKIKEKE